MSKFVSILSRPRAPVRISEDQDGTDRVGVDGGEETIAANARKALRQDVAQEASAELPRIEFHELASASVTVVLPREAHLFGAQRGDPPGRDRDPVDRPYTPTAKRLSPMGRGDTLCRGWRRSP